MLMALALICVAQELKAQKSGAYRAKDAEPLVAAKLLQISEARRGLLEQERLIVAQAAELGTPLDLTKLESAGWIEPAVAAPPASRVGRVSSAIYRIFVRSKVSTGWMLWILSCQSSLACGPRSKHGTCMLSRTARASFRFAVPRSVKGCHRSLAMRPGGQIRRS